VKGPLELGGSVVTADSIAPGSIETGMTTATTERMGVRSEDFEAAIVTDIPVGRTGVPADIAHAVPYSASEEARFVSGQVLYVAGGPRA
jgi:3-oxoacyl-[acyl-carrier protein] reductase